MAFSRRLGVIGILSASWLVAVGCSEDEGKKVVDVTDGGEAGETNGGKASSGGSTAVAGKGGMATAGKGGSSGTGGTSAGASGEAGSGQAGGSTAGESAGGAGSAGESSGGAGGAAGGEGGAASAGLLSCTNECENDDDCAIGLDTTQKCDQVTFRCTDALLACQSLANCRPWANDWRVSCESSATCLEWEACVEWEGKGYCATKPLDGCFPGEATALPERGGNGDVQVCVVDGGCKDNKCTLGCGHPFFAGCDGAGDGDTCNPGTQLCECGDGTECESGVCGANSLCQQCVTSGDCPGGLTGLDTCVNGKCGCSESAACPDFTTAGTPLCE